MDNDPAELRAAANEKQLQRRANMILEMFNADIRLPNPRHIEAGCCPGGPEEVKSKFLLALTEGVGALLNKSGLPAEAKWGSMATANSELQLAVLVHGVFHQVFLLAYPQDRKVGVGGADEYHALVHQSQPRQACGPGRRPPASFASVCTRHRAVGLVVATVAAHG